MYNDNNIFAKILKGEIPCKKVYEDDYALSFHDINPKAPVHVLVVPKGKFTCFTDFALTSDKDFMEGYLKAIEKTADELGLNKDGYRIVFNNGKNGGQEVPHLHAHILGGKALAF
ncbi:MAG: HIT-like protein [Alphaproteobacteria bacterium ADurb.Bin438]|nr:MAG: HIT-like protein [Alphaproteobacteria bacterium ADurb.Bin438]